MFSLRNAQLIRLNSDGSDAEAFRTKRPSITFGTSVLCDYLIKNESSELPELAYEISKDKLGRVSWITFSYQFHLYGNLATRFE